MVLYLSKTVIVEIKFNNKTDIMSDRPSSKQRINYDYEYRKYLDMCARIPQHLKTKLQSMPNNKGYIWNNILLFGLLPPTREKALILFERRQNKMYIHEYRGRSHKIIEQDRSNNTKRVVFQS